MGQPVVHFEVIGKDGGKLHVKAESLGGTRVMGPETGEVFHRRSARDQPGYGPRAPIGMT